LGGDIPSLLGLELLLDGLGETIAHVGIALGTEVNMVAVKLGGIDLKGI
jgi:hypothetical protein